MRAARAMCSAIATGRPNPSERLTMVVVHGLEGSSRSHHVLGNSARAWAAGCNVIRMNMRNCGGTEDLSPTLYHSGLSGDVAAVMQTLAAEKGLAAFALVGYSMGGNLVLKLAGELGENAPEYLKAVVGVSPAMDLAASADALHNVSNRVYEWKFLIGLRRRFRRKAELFPASIRPLAWRGSPPCASLTTKSPPATPVFPARMTTITAHPVPGWPRKLPCRR